MWKSDDSYTAFRSLTVLDSVCSDTRFQGSTESPRPASGITLVTPGDITISKLPVWMRVRRSAAVVFGVLVNSYRSKRLIVVSSSVSENTMINGRATTHQSMIYVLYYRCRTCLQWFHHVWTMGEGRGIRNNYDLHKYKL